MHIRILFVTDSINCPKISVAMLHFFLERFTFRSTNVLGLLMYIFAFKYPHKKKILRIKSQDVEAQLEYHQNVKSIDLEKLF